MLLASADMLLSCTAASVLKISLDNLCAPTKQQTCLLTAVPPHQVTQDSPVLPFHVALLTLDLAVQLVMNPPRSKLNSLLES